MLPELREKYGVQSLALFGSYARGEQTPESDLDLLVDLDPVPGLFTFVELIYELEDALGVTVDLFTDGSLKPRLKERILNSLVPV
jgi:uncharacterized protein